jgi:hypothetical protein
VAHEQTRRTVASAVIQSDTIVGDGLQRFLRCLRLVSSWAQHRRVYLPVTAQVKTFRVKTLRDSTHQK